LPNINGDSGGNSLWVHPAPVAVAGALKTIPAYSQGGTTTSTGGIVVGKVTFNAYDSNSVYTNNGKVYPASIALNFIIKT